MITPDILPTLRCPHSHEPLEFASSDLVAAVNRQIAVGDILDEAGERATQPIDGGLVPRLKDGQDAPPRLYPIREQIPTLIFDEALCLGNLSLA